MAAHAKLEKVRSIQILNTTLGFLSETSLHSLGMERHIRIRSEVHAGATTTKDWTRNTGQGTGYLKDAFSIRQIRYRSCISLHAELSYLEWTDSQESPQVVLNHGESWQTLWRLRALPQTSYQGRITPSDSQTMTELCPV